MKRWIYWLALLLPLGLLIGWRLSSKRTEAAAQHVLRQARMKAPPVVTAATATTRDIVHTFVGVGSVDAPLNVRIASKVTGLLTFIQVREGDRVTRGQVLARIDPSQVNAAVRQAQANVSEARQRLEQARLMQSATNIGVTSQIDQQVAGVASAQADLNQVQRNYDAQVATAKAAVTDAQGRVNNTLAAIANAEAGIRSAQSNLNNARVRYDRTNDLYKQGFVAAQDVDDARTTVDVQKGNLDVAEGQLNSAQAARDSAVAQKASAQQQLSITKVKGTADIEAAQAKYQQAQAILTAARANRAQTPAYQQNLAALRSAVAAAEEQLHNTEAQLSDTSLTSSVSGFVTTRYADPGSVVTAGQTVVAVEDIRQVYVTVSVPEEISRFIHQGQTTSSVFDALPGQTFAGAVTQVNPAADVQSRQFTVRVTLNNPDNRIKPGMFGRVTFITEDFRNCVVVPREAVHVGKGGATVVVIDRQDGKTAHIRPVRTGVEDASGIAVTDGLSEGDTVVTLSYTPVRDGQTVRVAVAGKGSL